MTDPRTATIQLLGPVQWDTETRGYCACPGASLHTSKTKAKDCRVCSSPDALHVHHILYDGLAWQAPDNALISLCEKCHERAHNISKRHFLPIVGVCETHSATEASTLLSEGWGIMHFLPDDGFGSPKFIMGKL